MQNFVSKLAIFATAAHAAIRPDSHELPRNSKTLKVEGQTQAEHTTDSLGRFKHPFRHESNDVQSISYPESGTYSTKLHRKPGYSRHGDKSKDASQQNGRVIGSSHTSSYLDYIVKMFEPLQATYQTPTTNYANFNYLGEVYMGSDQQKFMVVWDTGSSALLLESSACSGCQGDVFQIDDSSSFAYASPADTSTTEYLDGTKLEGQWASDKACPTEGDANGCANAYPFVAMTTAKGLGAEEDGILGMWSGNSSSADQNEMFMVHLKADSDIAEQTFSFYMTGVDGDSYIDFGTPNSAVMNGSPTYITIDSDNDWWSSALTGFRWDSSMTDDNEYAITSGEFALTDTGSSCIIGPSGEADAIINNILNELDEVFKDFGREDYYFLCPNNDDLPSFSLLFGGYWMEVLPEDYIVDISTAEDRTWCTICISSIQDFDEWILGDAFMRGWYNIHDHENTRMGFVPFTGSSKSAPVSASSTPTGSLPDVKINGLTKKVLGINATVFWITVTVLTLGTIGLVYFFCFAAVMLYQTKTSVLASGKKILQKSNSSVSNQLDDAESSISLIYLQ